MTNFDEHAKDWDSDPKKVERARVVAKAIRNAVPLSADMNALEYGCGTGLLSFVLQENLGQITLADTSQGMLDVLSEKIAKTGVTNMHPVRLDLSTDALPTEKYQITYSLMVLHHIHDAQGIISKFYDVLEPNGYLLVADLDKEDGSFHTNGTTDVHKGFEQSQLKSWVETAGFGNIKFSIAYEIKREADGKEQIFPIFLMVAQKTE